LAEISSIAGVRRYAANMSTRSGWVMATLAGGKVAPGFDTDYFRAALSQLATGTTIVMTRASDGSLHGLTVNSFNSVSFIAI
jgi:flavin reductase (DIM6/NTAB) family NADH-FMN oxidoreductase RutF